MRLIAYNDYTLRTLMQLDFNGYRLLTIQSIAELHGISRNHLMKVVHQLGLSGMVETVRGRIGGLRLNREPAKISAGGGVRNTGADFFMAECFECGSKDAFMRHPAHWKARAGLSHGGISGDARWRHARRSDRKRSWAR